MTPIKPTTETTQNQNQSKNHGSHRPFNYLFLLPLLSMEGVRIYQRISETQHQAVSDILSAKRICVQHPIPPEQPQSSEVVPIQRQSSTFELSNTTFTFILALFACSSVTINIDPRTQHTYRFYLYNCMFSVM